MTNIFLCLCFFSFDLLDSEWETEKCHEESGLDYSQMGVATKFLHLCVKLHPKLSVPKNTTKPKTIHKQIRSKVWGQKPNNQTRVLCFLLFLHSSMSLQLVLSTVKSCLNSVGQWKWYVKIQHWLYCISKSNINTNMRDYLEQLTCKDLFRFNILIWCYLCS